MSPALISLSLAVASLVARWARLTVSFNNAGLVSIGCEILDGPRPNEPERRRWGFLHLWVDPSCRRWGFYRLPDSIMDAWEFGLGPILLLCGMEE